MIGTAQELPCDHCGKPESSHVPIVGLGKVCPVSGTTFSNAKWRALASRIAEVERLLDAIDWARDFEPQLVDQILDRAALSQHGKL